MVSTKTHLTFFAPLPTLRSGLRLSCCRETTPSVAPDRCVSSQIEVLDETVVLLPRNRAREPYFPLLLPTTNHFCPHLNLTTILVKRIRALSTLFFRNV